MKILELRLQAFGPFLSEQHIDFRELNSKGMFLINGPTGTGKTSLFDAVVYALYGAGSGQDRKDGKTLRSDFAKDEDVTFVDLTFEANNQIYRVVRKAPYYRQAKRGSGLTLVTGTAELYLPDGTVISRQSDVDAKLVNDILFIDRDQFKSVALLAQGEFTELITADTKKRAPILEHIFQKHIYNNFQDKIREKFKHAEEEKNAVITSVYTLIKKVDEAEEIIGYEEALKDPSNIPTFLDNLDTKIKQLKEELVVCHEATVVKQKEYNEVNAKLIKLKEDNIRIKQYLTALNNLETLKAKDAQMKELELEIEKQEEFNQLSPLFKQLENNRTIIGNCERDILSSQSSLKLLMEIEKGLSENKDTYDESKEQVGKYNTIHTNLISLRNKKSVLLTSRTQLELSDKKFANNYIKYLGEEKKFLDVKKRFFASASYNLAKELQEGIACPVCGSTHHPNPALATDSVSEAEYKNAEANYIELTDKINSERLLLEGKKKAHLSNEESMINTLKENGYNVIDKDSIYTLDIDEEIIEVNNKITQFKNFINSFEKKERDTTNEKIKHNQKIESANNQITRTQEMSKTLDIEIQSKMNTNLYIKSNEDFVKVKTKNENQLSFDVRKARGILESYHNDIMKEKAIISTTPNELTNQEVLDESQLIVEEQTKKADFDKQNSFEGQLKNKINNLLKDHEFIEKAYEKCKDKLVKYTSLSELDKVTSGSNKMKLSFKMYILADYFEMIINQANKRLSKITNGRYKLIRRVELGKGNAQNGLDLNVYDIETGKERPASSLSGGEKFVSALSMALGLSDIIETNHALVQVESIFIDEGFGSLDENYLDMAMKALETLKDDNKTVAIISHVEKLKEYITDGLEVKKASIGSTVKMKDKI